MLDLIRDALAGVSLRGLAAVALLTIFVVCTALAVHTRTRRTPAGYNIPAADWAALVQRRTVLDTANLTRPLPGGLSQDQVDEQMATAAAAARKGRRGYDSAEAEQEARAGVQRHVDRVNRQARRDRHRAVRRAYGRVPVDLR